VRSRAFTGAITAALLVMGLFSAPLPLTTTAEGVVWLPENGEVRAAADGELGEWLATPGSSVQAGQPLAQLDDPTAGVALATAAAEVRAAEARYLAARATDAVDAVSMLVQLQRAEAEYAAALERSEARLVTSPTEGVFVVAHPEDLPGRYFHQGDVIGYVVAPGQSTVLAVVAQNDIGLIQTRVGDVQIRLSENLAQVRRATISRLTPAGDFNLPSAALGTTGGGAVAVSPGDASGQHSLARVFRVELTLDEPFGRLGGRAFVRFDHGSEALVLRSYRRLRQLLLRHLDA
jgi:putative peptide zinc metalloprotease protein